MTDRASDVSHLAMSSAGTADSWVAHYAAVPVEWKRPDGYRLNSYPFIEVFTRNTKYLASNTRHDFRPAASQRMGEEVVWWLYTCWNEGTRKVEPSILRWWQRAVDALASRAVKRGQVPGKETVSITDLPPTLVIREALAQFQRRHGRLPAPGSIRNLKSVALDIHSMLVARCADHPWWDADVWRLDLDPRIPRRPHEPAADRAVNIGAIEPDWLREGVRFWLSRCLVEGQYAWSSLVARANRIRCTYGQWCQSRNVSRPAVASSSTDIAELRRHFLDFLSWLRSPASTKNAKPTALSGVVAAQSSVQAFYEFMYERADEAVAATGHNGWHELTATHTRLWAPQDRTRRPHHARKLGHIAAADLSRMIGCLDVLSTPTNDTVTIELPGQAPFTTRGLGDPQAARIWFIQALTGRRASEVLMLDFHPYTRLPVTPTRGERTRDSEYVARLRYQQTKIDGVDPTILVEQAVINLISEQQEWVRVHYAEHSGVGGYLFMTLRGNFRGRRPRAYRSYQDALKRLDSVLRLKDSAGQPLRFTQTHRLRHTRATELLNAGVPIHVVQRYLGHRSPEMTMRYAATLAETAEAEFLRYKKIGADGRDITIAPRDILDLAQLDRRADRILPNGVCLLPPTQTCDKGNACLPCGHFATDATHLDEHLAQRNRIETLVAARTHDYHERYGTPMPTENIWLTGRRRELDSLNAIIDRVTEEADAGDNPRLVTGAGSSAPVEIQLVTDGADAAALHEQLRSRRPQGLAGETRDC